MEYEFEINKEITLKVKMPEKPKLKEFLGLSKQMKAIQRAVEAVDKDYEEKSGVGEEDEAEPTKKLKPKPKWMTQGDRIKAWNMRNSGASWKQIAEAVNQKSPTVYATYKTIQTRMSEGQTLEQATENKLAGKPKGTEGQDRKSYTDNQDRKDYTQSVKEVKVTVKEEPAVKLQDGLIVLSNDDKKLIWTMRKDHGLKFQEIVKSLGKGDVNLISGTYYKLRDKVNAGKSVEEALLE